jgi:hypothetical protein
VHRMTRPDGLSPQTVRSRAASGRCKNSTGRRVDVVCSAAASDRVQRPGLQVACELIGHVRLIFSLTRFRLRPGTRALAQEWVRFVEAHRCAVREIMEREHMYVEAVFTETVDGIDYLYWYSMQGDHDGFADPFDHWLDEHHAWFWRTCIDDAFPPDELAPGILLTTEGMQAATGPRGSESAPPAMAAQGGEGVTVRG